MNGVEDTIAELEKESLSVAERVMLEVVPKVFLGVRTLIILVGYAIHIFFFVARIEQEVVEVDVLVQQILFLNLGVFQ